MHVVSIPLYPYTQEISVNYVYTEGYPICKHSEDITMKCSKFHLCTLFSWIQSTNVLISPHILSWPCNMNLKFAINLIDLKYWPLFFLLCSILPNTSSGRWWLFVLNFTKTCQHRNNLSFPEMKNQFHTRFLISC